MDEKAKSALQAELAPGEKLIWAGQPRQGLVFYWHDLIFIPWGLLFSYFTLIPVYLVINYFVQKGFAEDPTHVIVMLIITALVFTIPFILGLYFSIGRIFVDIYVRRRTYYSLTEHRALIQSGLFRRRTQSINPRRYTEISLREKRNGRGTITFGVIPSPFSFRRYFSSPDRLPSPSFESIPDARRVYELVRDIQLGAELPA